MKGLQRTGAAALAGLVLYLCGCATIEPGVRPSGQELQAKARCSAEEERSDAALAALLKISPAQLERLRRQRAIDNHDLCVMPERYLQRALARLDNPKPDHPGEWASFRALQEADERGVVRPDGLLRGIAQRRAMLDRQADAAGPLELAGINAAGWTALGPGNIGGRVRAILAHPTLTNKLWAGSVSGGIWVSTDGGASWSPVNDFMGNLSITSLVMDPSDANKIYAATGEGFYNIDAKRGAGIFRSTDGGATWSQLSGTNPASGSQWYYVNRMAVHPSNGNILLAATGSGTYRSTDGGGVWTQVASGRALDVRFNPSDGNNAIVGRDNGQVLYSTNAGTSFTPVTLVSGAARVEVAYAASTASTAYAVVNAESVCSSCAYVYTSTDGGANWSYVSSPNHLSGQGWYNNTLWVDPTTPAHLIIGGLDLWRSTNSGASWTKISQWYSAPSSPHADHHTIVSAAGYNGSSNRKIYFGNDGGVYQAADITAVGLTSGWTALNNGLGVTQFYGGAGRAAAGGRIVGGTQDNGDLKWSGAGTNWSAIYGGDGGYSAADSADDNYLYGEYVYLAIHRSTNGGATTSIICNGITEGYQHASWGCGTGGTTAANFIAPFILDPNNNNRMLAGAKSLWISDNVKASTPSWAIRKGAAGAGSSYYISAIAVAEGNPDIIWVGHNNGSVYYTTNGSAASPTWTQVTGLPSRMVLRFLIDKDDHNRVYVAFGGYSASNLWRSTNGGSTWTDIHGALPSVPVRSVLRHPSNSNWLYAGTEVGVFTSENGGGTWATTNDGPANVSVDELFWYDNTRLVAVTHGRGLFMTTVGSAGPAVPGAPTGVTASAGNTSVSVGFTPPASDGGAAIDNYRANCNPGSHNAIGAASPILVTGLGNGTAYTCTVEAHNSVGWGPPSAASNSVTPSGPTVQRAYVSAANGNDGNVNSSCQVSAPCRTFAAALPLVATGGEVLAMSSGDYGTANLLRSVALVGAPGQAVSLTASSGAAITIASPGVKAVVRNLRLVGAGASYGIHMTDGAQLNVENSIIGSFALAGISVFTAAKVQVFDSLVRDQPFGGLRLYNGAKATVARTKFLGNGFGGVIAECSTASTLTRATVIGSVFMGVRDGNDWAVTAESYGNCAVEVEVTRSSIAHSSYGAIATAPSGGTAALVLNRSRITDNDVGLVVGSGNAALRSRGNNTLNGNISPTSGLVSGEPAF